jgi:hypothetical protein
MKPQPWCLEGGNLDGTLVAEYQSASTLNWDWTLSQFILGSNATGSASAVLEFAESTDTDRASGTRILSLDAAGASNVNTFGPPVPSMMGLSNLEHL